MMVVVMMVAVSRHNHDPRRISRISRMVVMMVVMVMMIELSKLDVIVG